MAGVYVGDNASYVQQHEQEAAKNMSTGAMVGIEALVNGASMAKLPCRYTASPNGYGVGTVACSPSFPFPPQP